MKSKLNRRRGFTIAEIIIAVAIMATLIAVLMKGLQTSRANIKRDTYQAEIKKRALTIGAKAEAYVLEHGSITGFTVASDDKKDPVGEDYAVTAEPPAQNRPTFKITLAPQAQGVLTGLGVTAESYEFK